MPKGTLVFDVETHSADLLYTMPPEEFVRLIGYAWDDGDVVITTDLEELRGRIMSARWIIGHNIHSFDLRAVFGTKSNIPLELTDEGRVYDTWTHSTLAHPAPISYINRFGKGAVAEKPEQIMKWHGLDEQCHQLGLPGKTQALADLAEEFGGFGNIPIDDERFRAYLVGDVVATRSLARALLKRAPLDAYALRLQRVDSRMAAIASNGFRVDIPAAQARADALAARREEILSGLVDEYGFPTEGDAPWATDTGKAAILAALADQGITPASKPDWLKTPTWEKRSGKKQESLQKALELDEKIEGWFQEIEAGDLKPRSVESRLRRIKEAKAKAADLRKNPLPVAFGLSLAGETLIELTKGTPAAELGQALAELKGQRSLSTLTLDSVHPDGYVHPSITNLQKSRRWSTTKPGLTVWNSHGDGAVEKSYFIPDDDDQVLISLDYSNADARIVAAYSGDTEYAKRFVENADGHMINALAAWGKETVEADPAKYRQLAKPLGHGWSYGGRAKGLAKNTGLPLEITTTFVDGMDKAFRRLVSWQNHVRKEAGRGYVTNAWGGKLWVDKERIYTQAPALLGQNGTTEIMCDALLMMPYKVLRTIKAQIHDELIASVPKKNWEQCRDYLVRLMSTEFHPKGGQRIEFPVSSGPAGANWMEASHE